MTIPVPMVLDNRYGFRWSLADLSLITLVEVALPSSSTGMNSMQRTTTKLFPRWHTALRITLYDRCRKKTLRTRGTVHYGNCGNSPIILLSKQRIDSKVLVYIIAHYMSTYRLDCGCQSMVDKHRGHVSNPLSIVNLEDNPD